ncbi:MAG: hypothetical protein ABIQ77_11615 [Anaerolineales bacterium]
MHFALYQPLLAAPSAPARLTPTTPTVTHLHRTPTPIRYGTSFVWRINSTLYYTVSTGSTRRLKDHLGSASVVTDASGNILGENRYYPFGETRLTTGTIFTDKLFTGQRTWKLLPCQR